MDATTFTDTAQAEGFETLTRDVAPGTHLDEHDHAWDVRGLVLAGQFTIACAGDSHTYAAGEMFELPAGTPHTEGAGPEGASLLLARRHSAH